MENKLDIDFIGSHFRFKKKTKKDVLKEEN